jgi:M3 family oligoendopeptidase
MTQPHKTLAPPYAGAHYAQLTAERPAYDTVASRYDELYAQFDSAQTDDARAAAVHAWDNTRRHIDTWKALVHLKFNQDTTNETFRADREYCDELSPKLTDLDIRFKKKLLDAPSRAGLEARIGSHAFKLWACDVTTFNPVIQDDLVEESKTESKYVELMSSAKITFRGETLNLPAIGKYTTSADRQTRHEAEFARWGWYEENSEPLDTIFDQLVGIRDRIAKKLGFANYIGLGYQRMARIDYSATDLDTFRSQIRRDVVPLAVKLREAQAKRLGLDKLNYWDEGVHELSGNPKPLGDSRWQTVQAQTMFDRMGTDLGEFFRMMDQRGLLDLDVRDGKAGGGFCTSFVDYGVPFIFANFNGTKGDVEVFTHEMGHAFQAWRSRGKNLTEYLWPTMESCEIHSMSLEFLTWPHMELFFGPDAERFRRVHLTESTLFLPYGTAVDHFQHLVYGQPKATPAERKGFWQDMEKTYLPWRDFGDLKHPASGGMWQGQRHIYSYPFYYIDYVLAQTCALQFLVRSAENFDEAMSAYVALCDRGGEAPFQTLARGAGLLSPFDDGVLTQVAAHAGRKLGVA